MSVSEEESLYYHQRGLIRWGCCLTMFIISFRHGLIIVLYCGCGVGMLFVLRVVGPVFPCFVLQSVPLPVPEVSGLQYSVVCVCGLPSAVWLDVQFVAGIVVWVLCLSMLISPPRLLGGSFGCSYAPCLTIHWSSSAFESVMVFLLEFSIILGYRVKVSVAGGVCSCSWLGIIGSVMLPYVGVLHNIFDSG